MPTNTSSIASFAIRLGMVVVAAVLIIVAFKFIKPSNEIELTIEEKKVIEAMRERFPNGLDREVERLRKKARDEVMEE